METAGDGAGIGRLNCRGNGSMEGVVLMVTYSDLFTFVIMLCAVITLVIKYKK